jgi:hypothetical protein
MQNLRIKLPLHTLASYLDNSWWHLQMGTYTGNNNHEQFFKQPNQNELSIYFST